MRFRGLCAGLLLAASAHAFVWPNQIDRVREELHDADVATRRGAAHRIQELPSSVAGDLAMVALVDPDAEVRLEAVEVAVRLAPGAAVPVLVPWLSDPDRRLRIAAARGLAIAPDERALGALGRILADPDAEVREVAALALGSSERPEAARLLLGHLDDSVPRVREVVVDALARLGDAASVVPLLGKVQDPTLAVRRRVVRALGELGDDRAASSLLLALQDPDQRVRIEALHSLGALRVAEAVPSIVALLKSDEDGLVRREALAALGALGSSSAVAALLDLLTDPGPGLAVERVAEVLGRVGVGAEAGLTACLAGQPSTAVAGGCARALGIAAGPQAVGVLTAALRRGVVEPEDALDALGRLRDPAVVPTVLEYLGDADPATRAAAVEAAENLLDPREPDGRAVAPIARALAAARQGDERLRLVRLLGKTGAPDAVSPLVPLLGAVDDPALRLAAITALGELAPAGQDRELLKVLADPDGAARWAAAVSLYRCASGEVAEPLVERLESASMRERSALALALGGALARGGDASVVERVAALARRSRAGERDSLVEALGRAPSRRASALVEGLGGADAAVPDRAKVAEALATHAESLTVLRRLARDADGAVRANAVWSLGQVGTAADAKLLGLAVADPDVAVAGNAVGALARLAARTRFDAARAICSAFSSSHPYVRANALVGASLIGERCEPSRARRLVLADPAPLARRAAAVLLLRVPDGDRRADRDALARCAEQDRDGAVAVTCAGQAPPIPSASEAVTVVVVPAAEAGPLARAPFALVLADGLMRLGVTDRRGVVFEATAPRGELALEVPAPLGE